MTRTWDPLRYARLAEHLMPAARACVQRVAPAPGSLLLDVATGTGNALVAAGPSVRGIGVDSSAEQLDAARERCAGLAVTFHHADAERLPLGDDVADTAVSVFGVIFAPRPEVALREMVRCTRPGGRVGVTALRADGWPARARQLLARHAEIPTPPMPMAWSDPSDAADAAGRCGLTDVHGEIREIPDGRPPDQSPDETVEGFTVLAELRHRLAAAGRWDAARADLAELLSATPLTDRYVLVTGTVA